MKYLHPGPRNKRLDAGFTLVELIAVLVIAAILAGFAISRFINKPAVDVFGYFNQAEAIIRYGQKAAVAGGANVFVRLNGTSVALCYDAACASPVLAPSGSNSGSSATLAACGNNKTWYCEASPSSVTYTASNASGTNYIGAAPTFFFSPQGKPYNAGDSEPVTNFNALLTVQLTASSGSTNAIYVERETGYVHH
jgi:MSHA pilin protein MshC